MDDLQQPTVGALLKSRRLERGLSPAEIASRTHIRRAYLEALEDDRFDALPGEAYQSGFLRNYAEALGLEPGSVLRQWREQTGRAGDGKRRESLAASSVLQGASPARRPRRRAALLLLPLLLAAVAALYFAAGDRGLGGAQVPAWTTPARPQPADRAAPPAAGALTPPAPPGAAASGAAPAAAAAENGVGPVATERSALPAIPPEGSVIRLEAMGPLAVEVAVDSRPLQRYVLGADSALQWSVGHSARLAVDDPEAVKVWLGGAPLDLAGRSEIVLQAATPE